MKQVGILTFHFAENYGAVFQAYGLVKGLSELGLDTQIINYHPTHVESGGNFRLPTNKKNIRANLVIAFQKAVKIIALFRGNDQLKEKFEEFRVHHLYISDRKFKTLAELKSSPPKLDVYVCGSDQIWNPSEQYGVDPAYYLDFGEEKINRVSYAASFGRDTLDRSVYDLVGRLLAKLDAISVRENSGVEIVKSITGKVAEWMPDPTFLLDSYDQVIKQPSNTEPYMFSYVLRSGGGISDIQTYLAEKLSLKILVPYNPMRRWKTIGETIYPGPEEWLGYIKFSDFVLTNSFHGTVFSILFNKPFITIGLSGKKSGLNERAKSLLTRLGLEHRLLVDLKKENVDVLIEEDIDWEFVNIKLAEWRNEATGFITKEIIGANE